MNPCDALRLMVRQYPGGLEVMALRIGKRPEVLRKELAGAEAFKLGLNTAMVISEMCIEAASPNCHDFVNAIAAAGGGFVQLPVTDATSSLNLQRSMSDVIKEMSDVATSTIEGDADGVISDNDRDRALKEISEARAALQVHEMNILRKHAVGRLAAERAS